MKCYNHPERDAVSTCSQCGRALCKECTDKYTPIMCDDCRKGYVEKQKQESQNEQREWNIGLIKQFIIFIVLLAIGFVVTFVLHRLLDGQLQMHVKTSYLLLTLSIPFAWRYAIVDIVPVGCLLTLLTFLLKFFIATLLGPIVFSVAVYGTAKSIRQTFSNKAVGIILEVLFIMVVLSLIAVYYLFLRGTRMEYLYEHYGYTDFSDWW